MNREVFEYFFDPEELEPFYSQLLAVAKNPDARTRTSRRDVLEQNEALATDTETPEPGLFEEESAGDEPPGGQPTPTSQSEEHSTAVSQKPDPPSQPKPTQTAEPPAEAARECRTRVRHLLSVHALGQYVYCARSAILAAECGDEEDFDEPPPRLTFLPNFDLERIEEMLSIKIRRLGISLLYSTSMAVLMLVGIINQNRLMFYPAFTFFLVCILWLVNLIGTVLQLAGRRRAALKAEMREPDPQISGIQDVNWWSMLKAGFEPVNYQRPFRHPELPLEGCPWRVLERR